MGDGNGEDNDIQLLSFGTLSIILYLFKTLVLENKLSPCSGKTYSVGQILHFFSDDL
jgi:hypothetical protein